jgi:uncharacterized protein (TIGR02118 family)
VPKLMVIYPTPADVEAFEKVYQDEHVPIAVEKISGKTKIVASRVVGSPAGDAPYHRIAEVHFASMEDLERSAATSGTQETLAHAAEISTGGAPVLLIAEEEVFEF